MQSSLFKKLIFFGWSASVLLTAAIQILNIFIYDSLTLGPMITLQRLLISLSGYAAVAILGCYVMLFLTEKNFYDLAIGALFLFGIIMNILMSKIVPGYGSDQLGFVTVIFGMISGAYCLPWALKEKDKNPLLMILLGCAFAYIAFGNILVNAIFARFGYLPVIIISALGSTVCAGIRALAAFSDMND